MEKVNQLISVYDKMSDAQIQDEIDSIFEIIWALLESTQSDSIESYPNPNIRLKFSCEVLENKGGMQ